MIKLWLVMILSKFQSFDSKIVKSAIDTKDIKNNPCLKGTV